jgi:hypothetical protein
MAIQVLEPAVQAGAVVDFEGGLLTFQPPAGSTLVELYGWASTAKRLKMDSRGTVNCTPAAS